MAGQRPADALWFNPPDGVTSRHTLTRARIAAEALTVISTDGAQPLSRACPGRNCGIIILEEIC